MTIQIRESGALRFPALAMRGNAVSQVDFDALEAEIVAAREGEASLDAKLDIMESAAAATTAEVVEARQGESTLNARITPFFSEIVTARGGEASLDTRLDTITAGLTTTANEVVAARDGNPSLDARLDIMGLTTTEVMEARGGFSDLDARLDTMAADITDAGETADTLTATKVDKTLPITVTPGSPLVASSDFNGASVNFNIPVSTAAELRSGLHPGSVATPPAMSELYTELNDAAVAAQATANLAMAAIENAEGSSDSLDHRLDAIETSVTGKVDKLLPITVTPGSPLVTSADFNGASVNFNIPVSTAAELRSGLHPGSVATPPAVAEIYDEINAAIDAVTPRATTHASLTTGSSVEYVAVGTPPLTSMALGRLMTVVLHTDCGAAPFITIDGIRARMVKPSGSDFATGELPAGHAFTFVSRSLSGGAAAWRFVNWQEWLISRVIDAAFTVSEADAVKARDEAIARAVSLVGRPGEFPQQWSMAELLEADDALVGPVDARPLMDASHVATTAEHGTALLLTASGIVAPRTSYRVEPGQVYSLRAVVSRGTNPLDPAGDAVAFRLRCLTYALQGLALPAGDIELDRKDDLTEASGRWEFVKTFSVTPGLDTDFVLPATTGYVTPYLALYGAPVAVYVEVLTPPLNLTDATLWAPDVSAFETRLAALESEDLPTRMDAVEASLTGSEVKWFKSRADFEAAAAGIDPAIPAGVDIVMTYQRWADRSGGGAKYTRVGSAPSAFADFVVDTVNGGWWVLDVESPSFLQLGIRPGAVDTYAADNFTRLQNALTLGPAGKLIRFGEPGIYRYAGNLVAPAGRILEGSLDHLDAHVLECSAVSGWAMTIEGRADDHRGYRLSATQARYDAASGDGGFLVTAGDSPSTGGPNRQRATRLTASFQPGDGMYVVGGAQGSMFEQLTIDACRGAGFRTDDGSKAGYANKKNAGLISIDVFRVTECGGQAYVLGRVGQTEGVARVDIKQVEANDCAWDPDYCEPIRAGVALAANPIAYVNGSNILTLSVADGHGCAPGSFVKFSGLAMANGWSSAAVNDVWLQCTGIVSMTALEITMDTPAAGTSSGDGGAAATWTHHLGAMVFHSAQSSNVDNCGYGGLAYQEDHTTFHNPPTWTQPKLVWKAPVGGIYWYGANGGEWTQQRFIGTAFAGMADAEGTPSGGLPTTLSTGIRVRGITAIANPVFGNMPFGFLFPKNAHNCTVESEALSGVTLFMWTQHAIEYTYNEAHYIGNAAQLKGQDIRRSLAFAGAWGSDTLDTDGVLAINADKMNVAGLVAATADNCDAIKVFADAGYADPARDMLLLVCNAHDAAITFRSVGNLHLPRGNVVLQPTEMLWLQFTVTTGKWTDIAKLGTSFAQSLAAPAGTAAAPGLTIGADTGLYRMTAGQMGLSLSGVLKAAWKDGEFLWGSGTLEAVGGVTAGFQVQGTNPSRASQSSILFSNSPSGADILVAHSRGATLNTHGLVQNNDAIGRLRGIASDGVAWRVAAQIAFEVDGVAAAADMPARIVMSTSPDGSASPVERVRIDNAGNVQMGGANTVIDASRHPHLRSYTVATLPSASPAAQLIYVSDGAANKRMAVSDGTAWRWPDGAVVS